MQKNVPVLEKKIPQSLISPFLVGWLSGWLALTKWFAQQKTRFLQNGMVDQKNVLTKCLLLLEKCPWNGTWVKPFHSGNGHRDEWPIPNSHPFLQPCNINHDTHPFSRSPATLHMWHAGPLGWEMPLQGLPDASHCPLHGHLKAFTLVLLWRGMVCTLGDTELERFWWVDYHGYHFTLIIWGSGASLAPTQYLELHPWSKGIFTKQKTGKNMPKKWKSQNFIKLKTDKLHDVYHALEQISLHMWFPRLITTKIPHLRRRKKTRGQKPTYSRPKTLFVGVPPHVGNINHHPPLNPPKKKLRRQRLIRHQLIPLPVPHGRAEAFRLLWRMLRRLHQGKATSDFTNGRLQLGRKTWVSMEKLLVASSELTRSYWKWP